MARWLDVELDRIVPPPRPVEYQRYWEAIERLAMLVLVDLLEHPNHQGLSRPKDPHSHTLYRAVADTDVSLLLAHVSDSMWTVATDAAGTVIARLGAAGYGPSLD
jgi:hypothetical protein